MIPDNLIKIANTDYWAIKEDQSTTPECQKACKLDWDSKYFLGIPEIYKIKNGSTVVDVGAFIGDTTKIFLDLGCNVHAFECQPDALICLKHNCPQAIIHDEPLGDGQSYLIFNGIAGNCGARFIVPNWNGPKTIKLDDLNLLSVDFLKIDVEGYEPFVLDGATKTISKFKPIIHIEVNWYGYMRYGFKESDILGKLENFGYKWKEARRGDKNNWDAIATPK